MKTIDKTKALLFVDDGHPEARDYDDNYVSVDACPSRSWIAFLGPLLGQRATANKASPNRSQDGKRPAARS